MLQDRGGGEGRTRPVDDEESQMSPEEDREGLRMTAKAGEGRKSRKRPEKEGDRRKREKDRDGRREGQMRTGEAGNGQRTTEEAR